MKKFMKWMGAAILVPVVLVASVAGLLYFPPFQRWAVKQASAYASEKTGMDISVGSVSLKFPLDLSLNDVSVVQRDSVSGAPGDTIARIGSVVADVQLKPLLKKQVVVDELTFENAHVNTADFIKAAHVKGDIGKLRVTNSDILLNSDENPDLSDVRLSDVLLKDADLDIVLADSVPEDTTESDTPWRIFAEKAKIENSDVRLTMPGSIDEKTGKKGPDTHVTAHLGDATISNGAFDLKNGTYKVGSVDIDKSDLAYDVGPKPKKKKSSNELDTNHLDLKNVSLKADDISYDSNASIDKPQLAANLKKLAFKEQSGLDVRNVSGQLSMYAGDEAKGTSGRLKLKNGKVVTSESSFETDLDMSLDSFSDLNPGTFKGTIHASLGKQDLMRFMGSMPAGFRQKWPNQQLKIDGVVRGNMKNLSFTDLNLQLPTAFKAKASGTMQNLDNPERLKADVDFDARGDNLDFVRELMPQDIRRDVRIPRGLAVAGHAKINGQQYDATFRASTPSSKSARGTLAGDVKFDANRMAYDAHLKANNLPLQQFLPNYGLSPLTGTIDVKGQGTDIMSPKTRLQAKADIRQFNYGGYSLAGMKANATIANGRAHANINSQNNLIRGTASLDALMSTNRLRGTLVTDLNHADLRRLGLVDDDMMVSGCAHLDIDSDLKQSHKVQGSLGDLTLIMAVTDSTGHKHTEIYRPDDMWVDLLTRRDTTHAVVDCGDFHLSMDADEGYEKLLKVGTQLADEVARQYDERVIDQARLRENLPSARIALTSGRENFFVEMMQRYGYDMHSLNCHLTSSPQTGLNGNLHLESLMVDSILLDTINFGIVSDAQRTTYQAQIRNNKHNPQYTFNALIDGIVQDRGTIFGTRLYDDKGELGVRLGLAATMQDDGFMFRSYGKDPILGYKTFHVNDDNYVFLGRDRRVSADVSLRADDGTGVQIYTNDDNTDALQDITASLHHFDLERVLSVIPYTPDVSGMMSGDFHVIQTEKEVSVSTNLDVKDMAYERWPMGDIGTEFVYMPKSDGSHYVDGILSRNGEEVATVSGTYQSEGKGYLDAQLGLNRLPLSLVNGFIPDHIIGLEGYGEGTLTMRGPLSTPDVDGEVYLDSAYLISQPYGVRLRFDNDPVTIKDSRLLFENFNMYANNDSPLTTYGYLDFSNLDRMRLDMRMRAQNFLLIDSKENARSEAYGKAYVNFYGTMNGLLSNLTMRGKLDVLGTTDLVYILRDSPLTTDNQLDELVRFTDFADTTQTVVTRPELTGFNMDMTVDVSKGAHVMAYLNTDKTNFIDLMGGGTLRMLYNTNDNLRLTGRYTLANGEMKYSLPIIPLKTFTIKDGSYIEFTGDPMNPTLNITATERVKAAVSASNGVGRSVDFECGVIITKTLSDMGLEFTLDAPEDMQMHNELQIMSLEQRGKLAVTMLTTGMYLADGDTNGFSMNNALNTFLQSEINNITGNALRTLDFSLGLDNTTDAMGNSATNYSFRFAKRFWNNRLKIAVGGKVTTGAEIENQNQSFFDNVTFEYRLDDTANKYVTLFYQNNVYDWLDGYTQKYGAGFIWRRSLQHFKDIFNLKSEKSPMVVPTIRRDSVRPVSVAPVENDVSAEDTVNADSIVPAEITPSTR